MVDGVKSDYGELNYCELPLLVGLCHHMKSLLIFSVIYILTTFQF